MAKTTVCDYCRQPVPVGPSAILDLPLVVGELPMDFCSQECLRSLLNGAANAPVKTVAPVPALPSPVAIPPPVMVQFVPALPAAPDPNGITFEGGPLDGQTHSLMVDHASKTVSVRVELEFEHGQAHVARDVTYTLVFGTNTASWPMDAEPWVTPDELKMLTGTPKIV